jgi:uncharacterized repeat protein (TIGR03803 family)
MLTSVTRGSVAAVAVAALLAACSADTQNPAPPATSGLTGISRAAPSEKVLYSFADGPDGGDPSGSIVFDGAGNAFGTTHLGGITNCGGQVGGGCGVVFELSPTKSGGWSESPLYAFADGSDGGFPNAGVILDKNGNLFGAASTGGSTQCSIGCGVVYELTKSSRWMESVLHTFTGTDGQFPNAVLFASRSGTLYSTTWYGGSSGNGTVFALVPGSSGWTETVLYSFAGTNDGSGPTAGVIQDKAGNLFSTTYKYDGDNNGVAFELRQRAHGAWKDRNLFAFTVNGDGENPYGGLLMDRKGNLFGTTAEGGTNFGGIAFELVRPRPGRPWKEKVLHIFGGSGDGSAPYGGLVMDKSGNLFGTTVFGGANNKGAVYEISATGRTWTEQVLYAFTGGGDGANPSGALALDSAGNLYGTTSGGGQSGYGVVFEVTP